MTTTRTTRTTRTRTTRAGKVGRAACRAARAVRREGSDRLPPSAARGGGAQAVVIAASGGKTSPADSRTPAPATPLVAEVRRALPQGGTILPTAPSSSGAI